MTAKGTSQRMDMSRTKWSHLIFVAISDDVLRPGLLNSTIVSCRLIKSTTLPSYEACHLTSLRPAFHLQNKVVIRISVIMHGKVAHLAQNTPQ